MYLILARWDSNIKKPPRVISPGRLTYGGAALIGVTLITSEDDHAFHAIALLQIKNCLYCLITPAPCSIQSKHMFKNSETLCGAEGRFSIYNWFVFVFRHAVIGYHTERFAMSFFKLQFFITRWTHVFFIVKLYVLRVK